MNSKLGFESLTISKSNLLILCFLFYTISVGAQGSSGLEMEVEPENPRVGDNIIVEVYMDGEPLEGVEVVSRNNLIGETDENGVLLFTQADSEDLVLTVEHNGDYVQRSLNVKGAEVSETESSQAIQQSATGQFISNPGNIYSLGFILGILGGFAALIKYRGGFSRLKGFFNL